MLIKKLHKWLGHTESAGVVVTIRAYTPGLAVSVLVALAAQFLAEHYGVPAMLMALLIGLSLNFLAEPNSPTGAGVSFTARSVLRIGVALLGARISVSMLAELGFQMIALVIAGVIATILFSLIIVRFFHRSWRFALLSGGSVAICGASAAMAISAVLPAHDKSERDLAFTVLSVTLLSTIAMIVYPIVVQILGMSSEQSGIFLGGTIHDVAQVVGAGFSVSSEVGETATLVKLIRVSMLAPVVLCFSLVIRRMHKGQSSPQEKPALFPGFVIAFLILAGLNSAGAIPAVVVDVAEATSRWALLIAIAAVGIKTSLRRMTDVGGGAIALLLLETIFLAVFVLGGIHVVG